MKLLVVSAILLALLTQVASAIDPTSPVWIVPAAGGGPNCNTGPSLINVQWAVAPFPSPATTTLPITDAKAVNTFVIPTNGDPLRLAECYASWTWDNCDLNGDIALGQQLAVGTVFSHWLYDFSNVITPFGVPNQVPQDPNNANTAGYPHYWNRMEAWCKYRVSDTSKISRIQLDIDDGTGATLASTSNWITNYTAGIWNTAYVTKTLARNAASGVNNFDLRAVINFAGASVPGVNRANIGRVTCDVEYFAFRLSGVE